MKINNSYVVPLTLVATIIAGAVAYGEQKSTVNDHDRRIGELEKTPLKVQEIDKRQAVIQRDIESLVREQRTYREQTVRTLDHILRKLDE